jgi:hypothetical protein
MRAMSLLFQAMSCIAATSVCGAHRALDASFQCRKKARPMPKFHRVSRAFFIVSFFEIHDLSLGAKSDSREAYVLRYIDALQRSNACTR